jgi:hypothetical protein
MNGATRHARAEDSAMQTDRHTVQDIMQSVSPLLLLLLIAPIAVAALWASVSIRVSRSVIARPAYRHVASIDDRESRLS